MLQVEPVTCEDWELLEMEAEWLEQRLLQQISVVYGNQVVDLRLSNGLDTARIRVLPGNFERDSIWPDDATTVPCYRLLAATQVVVMPKPRKTASVSSSWHLTLVPSREDLLTDPILEQFASLLNVSEKWPSVAQNTGAVHPHALENIRGSKSATTAIARICLVQDSPAGVAVIRLISSDKVPKECIGKSVLRFETLRFKKVIR